MSGFSKKTLRLILGDQLNIRHSWFEAVDASFVYLMMETESELAYVAHHIQKVIGFFMAMRRFRDTLISAGHEVIYFELDEASNKQTIESNIKTLIDSGAYDRFEYQEPDEYRLDRILAGLKADLEVPVVCVDSEHFYTSRVELAEFFSGKKTFVMESFYRHMRKKHEILMENNKPVGEKWNFDASNRKALPSDVEPPDSLFFNHDANEIVSLLGLHKIKTIGRIDPGHFTWPLTRDESLKLLNHFLQKLFSNFGTYQDAMTTRHMHLFHSRISFSLNTKMISPAEVVSAATDHWENNRKTVSIAQVEGFVRQILGWREYMRGIYWAHMPDYAEMNFFSHERDLPQFYWNGNTKMNCMFQAIGQSLDYAYAHHIQRLMVTGNFGLLCGIHPDQMDAWYLGIYIDAVEWVEMPNTRGMSQFADGGIVGTKPYVSTANYINKMSDYCKSCHYNHTKRTGEGACPFNSLFWNFYMQHEKLLSKNQRISMVYRNLAKMEKKVKHEIRQQADSYLSDIGEL